MAFYCYTFANMNAEEVNKQFANLRQLILDSTAALKKDIEGIESKFKEEIGCVRLEIVSAHDSVKKEISDKIDGIKADLTSQIDGIRKETASLDTRISKVESAGSENKSYVKTLSDTIATQTTQITSLTTALNASGDQISYLTGKVSSLEKACHGGLQHGRSWNIEIDGIPSAVGDERDDLEKAIVAVVRGIGVPANESDIEYCHRLPSKSADKTTIVRFHGRKIVDKINKNKNKLKNLGSLGIEMAGLSATSRIFIRASQCSYQKNLAFNCRVLKRAGLISSTSVSDDGKTRIKTLNDDHHKILHESDLTSLFPDFVGFSFEY